IAVTLAATLPLHWALWSPLGVFVLVPLAASLPAQRSLDEHVLAVAVALGHGLPEARAAVGRIVGRNTAVLDEAGVARAAIE
ncbi:cobalamin biosynthesis protein, partial [Mycobacterium tuberculosis]|nr:cobalamin biosynthesis protein [Mycobacterium tuberculosis]